jgi:hypothetical protein
MPEEKKIPEQHAFETGNVITPRVPAAEMAVVVSMTTGGVATQISGATHFSALHNAAAILHGWGKKDEPWGHRHHAGEPIKLTLDDYRKALEAASKTDEHGEYVPHPGALSEHCEAHAHHKSHAERVERLKAEREAEAKRLKEESEREAKRMTAEREQAEKDKGEKRSPRAAAAAESTTEAPKV